MRISGLAFFALIGCSAAVSDVASTTAELTQAATVVVHYPAGFGHRISVRGSSAGLDWNAGADAQWNSDDAWKLTLQLSAPIELKPLYDDAQWAKGPNWKLAPGQTLDVWPVFFHERGRVEKRANRTTIYFPPSYDENARERYPVVYMHDGQNLFDDASAFGGTSWNVAGAMDDGFKNGKIHEAIVVGIDNTSARIYEYTPTAGSHGGGGAAQYLDLVERIKHDVDLELRTFPDREHTAILGSSLGGLVSAWAGITHANTFGLIGAMSPSTWWDGTWIIGQVRNAPTLPIRVYVDSGNAGSSSDDVTNTAKLAQTYRERDANVKYVMQEGASHNEWWWRQRLPEALSYLVDQR